MHPTLISFLRSPYSVPNPRILFEIDTGVGSLVLRYSTDNQAIVYGGATWSPFPVSTKDFIRRLNESGQKAEMILWDPEETQLPGALKQLLQYENILGRSEFKMFLIFLDEIPSSPGNHFYENSIYTVPLYRGRIEEGLSAEGSVNLKLTNKVTGFDVTVPLMRYSTTCPWTFGDANCRRVSSGLTTNSVSGSVSSISSSSVITVTVSGTPSPENVAKFANGLIEFTSGDTVGGLRIITNSTYVSAGVHTLTLDRPVSGLATGQTINLKMNCKRTQEDCKARFNNEDNFGGSRSVIRVAGGYSISSRNQSR